MIRIVKSGAEATGLSDFDGPHYKVSDTFTIPDDWRPEKYKNPYPKTTHSILYHGKIDRPEHNAYEAVFKPVLTL